MARTIEERLEADGTLSAGVLAKARELARRRGIPVADVLIDEGMAAESVVLQAAAAAQGVPFVDLRDATIDAAAVRAVPAKLAAHYRIMPLRIEGDALTIAVSRLADVASVEDVETHLGRRVERVFACRADVREALKRHYGVGAETVERILADEPSSLQAIRLEESEDLEQMAADASVVRLVNQLIHEAIQARATDLHLEVQRDAVTVRRRVDGLLYDAPLPRNVAVLYPAMVSRIKLMSGLDIVERRLPQDGRARVRAAGLDYDLRISVVPSMHGEDIVLRILPTAMLFDVEELGFTPEHLAAIKDLIASPHGILFVTGPTGSGKSTTLYACLSRLNTRERKIVTIEDPVEYELSGITQTQVNPRIGLTFAAALRSMLRHDPDVMMVGEVRDRETAEIAVQTAMTGHLVMSTLHTNDAAGAAVRLIDMGVDPYLISSTVLAFVAQRLVRVICPACREEVEADGRRLFKGKGCRQCNGTGYRGRVAIAEFLPLAPDIERLIVARAPARDIRECANGLGMTTLAEDGWRKVAAGVTTAEEVLRVTRM